MPNGPNTQEKCNIDAKTISLSHCLSNLLISIYLYIYIYTLYIYIYIYIYFPPDIVSLLDLGGPVGPEPEGLLAGPVARLLAGPGAATWTDVG